MGGIFSKSSRPELAGTYMDFVTQTPVVVLPSVGNTVCVGFTHNWGPLKVPTLVTSFADFLDTFKADPAIPTSGYFAVKQAFDGDGDFGGAGAVLCHRMGGAAAAKATLTLQNTTPGAAITLSAKYEGSLGNGLSVTTQDHAADSTLNELLLYKGSTLLETYVYADTDIADLAAQINALSDWITAVETITGTALATVSNTALAGGNDGTTLLAADYTAAEAALETQRFGVLVFENLTDTSILASLATWQKGRQNAGQRFFTVVGGATDETATTAIGRAATLNDENMLTIGVGHVVDDDNVDVNGNASVFSTAQFAPRVAGSLAARGERYSLTFAKFPGIELLNGATQTDIARAFDAGVMVLDRASDANATVRINKGLTTYITKTDSTKPKVIYSNPKFVATMHGLQTDLVEWSDDEIIGKGTVDSDTRTAVLAKINELLRERELLGSVQPGWSAYVDPTPPPSDDDQFVAFVIAAKFGRSTEQVYFTGQLG